MKTYRINQIFYSLQGEGANTGTPAVFVRMAGCNLHCPFCDTDFSSYTKLTAAEICDEIEQFPSNFVVITGGEPSLQLDAELVGALHAIDCVVAVETNGTHPLPEDVDWITCSPKEGSQVVLTEADEVKVVYTGQPVEQYQQLIEAESYYLQPCDDHGTTNVEEVIGYCLAHPQWSLSLQTHKLLGIE